MTYCLEGNCSIQLSYRTGFANLIAVILTAVSKKKITQRFQFKQIRGCKTNEIGLELKLKFGCFGPTLAIKIYIAAL